MDTPHWIQGEPVEPRSDGDWKDITSPRDGEHVGRVALGTEADVDRAVRSAHAAHLEWETRAPGERSRILSDVADALRGEADKLVEIESRQSGMSEPFTRGVVGMSIDYFDYYAGLIRGTSGDVIDIGSTHHVSTRRVPYGVVASIVTWNASIAQISRNVAPALAAGNAVVAKPSEFTPTTAVELARIAEGAGLPVGLLNVVNGTATPAGESLVAHDLVRKIHFTGSVAAGRAIGEAAARRIVPVTMELGGKSPNIIFADADLKQAAQVAVGAFTSLAGQVCSSGTRLLVERTVHDEFLEMLVDIVRGMDLEQQVGPITTDVQYEKVGQYLTAAEDDGLEPVVGGRREYDRHAESSGAGTGYVPPTIYDGVSPSSRIAREEIFGPVLAVMEFGDEDEAVTLANDSQFGLVAGVWTRDIGRAFRVASRIKAGQVSVNQWGAPIEAPFGGFKASGFGREKGADALLEYTQVQTIIVNLAT